MDWDKEWERIAMEKFNQSSKLDKKTIMEAISSESQTPLAKLKFNLKAKTYWVAFFVGAFGLAGIIFHQNINMLAIFSFITAWYAIGLLYIRKQYRNLAKLDEKKSDAIYHVLKEYRTRVKAALRFEEIWGMSFFPIAVICGLLLPLFYIGMSVSEIIGNPKILLIAVGALVVMIPLAIYVSNEMNKIAFDKYMGEVDANLKKMEELE